MIQNTSGLLISKRVRQQKRKRTRKPNEKLGQKVKNRTGVLHPDHMRLASGQDSI